MTVVLVLFALVATLAGGCAGDSSGNRAGNAPVGSTSTTIATSGATIEQLQTQIFTPKCATAGCHNALSQAGDLNLFDAQTSFDEMVEIVSTCAGRVRVVSGDSGTSYLTDKLGDGPAPCGLLMPLTLPALDDDELQLIRDWINDGAPPPAALRAGSAEARTTTSTLSSPRDGDNVIIVP